MTCPLDRSGKAERSTTLDMTGRIEDISTTLDMTGEKGTLEMTEGRCRHAMFRSKKLVIILFFAHLYVSLHPKRL